MYLLQDVPCETKRALILTVALIQEVADVVDIHTSGFVLLLPNCVTKGDPTGIWSADVFGTPGVGVKRSKAKPIAIRGIGGFSWSRDKFFVPKNMAKLMR